MNMREKIARAIREAQARPHTDAEVADAVLDALMEPTEGMARAGRDAIPYPDTIEAPYSAMIRAAQEGK